MIAIVRKPVGNQLKTHCVQLLHLMVLAALALPGIVLAPDPTQAQSAGFRIRSSQVVQDSNRPPGRTFQCACVTSNDQITVYRVGGDAPISADLDEASDFEDTMWLVASTKKDDPQIAIWFHRAGGQLVADLFQDQDEDGRVSIKFDDEDVAITEPGFWSIRTVALDGYWQRDGRIAQNFDVYVDDQFMATFSGGLYLDAMKNDGATDVIVRVRGPRPGDLRSYDWRNVYTPVPTSSGVLRTVLMVREKGLEPAIQPQFPWYLLGNVTGLIKDYGSSSPPIQIDWETGRIAQLGEFVASRGSDENWFTYSIVRVEPYELTNPNFESPFAFYDLADDSDSVPELQIRVARMNPDDPYNDAPIAWQGRPYQLIRYSWDQANDQNWSYKLALMGQYTIESTVTFPEFSLTTIPYAELPRWVVERPWDIASFVAAETPLWTTEGIYNLDPSLTLRDSYYTGVGQSTGGFGETIDAGRRGEYALHLANQAWLYFSPIDRRLHLSSADSGIWNIDGQRQLKYLNSSSGPTFDGWQLSENGQLVEQLYRLSNGLLYSGADGTFFREVDIADSLFETLAPTNNAEWKALGRQLEKHQRALPDADLRAMFDQFGGEAIRVSSGPLSSFQRVGGNVSFVVQAGDAETQAALATLTSSQVSSGEQTVTVAGNKWTTRPAEYIPPELTIEAHPQGNLTSVPVQITIENPGAIPIDSASLSVRAVSADGRFETPIGIESVAVQATGSAVFSFPWSPVRAGTWRLEATVTRTVPDARTGTAPILLDTQETVSVGAETLSSQTAGRLGWAGPLLHRVATLAGLIMMAGVVATIALRRRMVP